MHITRGQNARGHREEEEEKYTWPNARGHREEKKIHVAQYT